jgi:hypothetical protein
MARPAQCPRVLLLDQLDDARAESVGECAGRPLGDRHVLRPAIGVALLLPGLVKHRLAFFIGVPSDDDQNP